MQKSISTVRSGFPGSGAIKRRPRNCHARRGLLADSEVGGLGVRHDDGGGGLLRHELVRLGERYPDCLWDAEQAPDAFVVGQLWDGGVAPAIAPRAGLTLA